MRNRCVIPNCESLIIGTGIVCEKCLARTRAQLAELPKLHADSANFLEPGRSSSGSNSSEPSIGVNVQALDFRRASDLLDKLWGWARIVFEDSLGKDRDHDERLLVKGSIGDQVTAVCRFLLKHSRWIERQLWVDDFCREVAALHGEGMMATRQTTGSTQVLCPHEFFDASQEEPELCGAILVFSADKDQLDIVRCRRCGTEWTLKRLIMVALDTKGAEVLLDAEAIAAQLGLEAASVRRYAKRNHIENDHGRYDLIKFMNKRGTIDQAKGA